jgi:dipeptidyl aminopeptidase/acylaminoacyl peptidase
LTVKKADPMPLKSMFLAAAITCCASASALAAAPTASPATIPLSAFFGHAEFDGAVLSPDGANVALLPRGPEGNTVLAVKPTAGGPARILAGIKGMDIIDIHWVNNHRLVFSANNRAAGESERSIGPGLHAINIDGSKRVELIRHTFAPDANRNSVAPNTHFLSAVHDEASNDIYVTRYNPFSEDFEGYTVLRLDTESANLKKVDVPQDINSVLIDAKGVPRAAAIRKDGRVRVLYNDPKSGAWRAVADTAWTSPELIMPAFVTPSGELFVLSRKGRDTRALYRLDTATGKLDPEPVIGLQNYDFSGSLVLAPDHDTVLGAHYETSEDITVWLDDGIKQLQARIDKALPSTINYLSLPEQGGDSVLVHSYSDVEPGFWQLYQRSTGSFTKLGVRKPAINPLQMAEMKMVHYKARDGREIPAYLTMPKGSAGKAPMVVLVHGGPWARGGHLEWQANVQFLASRGYAVLQPEPRGSTGFGQAHFEAGWRQWGKAMQDDIADGASWAIGQGVADPARICIAGASYGGYATLMGLANNPALFKCGVDWVGVTDINLLYDKRYTNTSEEAKQFGLPLMIGDQAKDAAMLKAVSPLENAARITQPLLLAYGGKDRTVPIEHGKKFYAAVKKTNAKAEWIEYEDEAHGWFYDRTNLDFWARVERFLAHNIGTP